MPCNFIEDHFFNLLKKYEFRKQASNFYLIYIDFYEKIVSEHNNVFFVIFMFNTIKCTEYLYGGKKNNLNKRKAICDSCS